MRLNVVASRGIQCHPQAAQRSVRHSLQRFSPSPCTLRGRNRSMKKLFSGGSRAEKTDRRYITMSPTQKSHYEEPRLLAGADVSSTTQP